MYKSYYDVLGVSPSATTDEIRRAYRRTVRTVHPDIRKVDDLFLIAKIAYDVLSDDRRRAEYDEQLTRFAANEDSEEASHNAQKEEQAQRQQAQRQQAQRQQAQRQQAGHAVDPLVPANFAGWFRRIVGVARRGLATLTLLQAISAVIEYLLSASLPFTLWPFLAVAVVSLSAFVQGASMFVAISAAAGRPATLVAGLRFAASRAFPLIGWQLLTLLVVGFAFFLLVVPGLYLAVVLFSSVLGVVVVERKGIGRCFYLIKGRFSVTAYRLLLSGLVLYGYLFVVLNIAQAGGVDLNSTLGQMMFTLLLIPVGVAVTGVAVITYAELRHHEQSRVTTLVLADEMTR